MNDELLLELQVADTGIGIAANDQERIFEPFVQADMSSTRKFGGTGLGLAICRRLTEKMGGQISVESTPGEGSSFVLRLPLRPFHEQPVLEQHVAFTPPVWEGPPLTVLIAEDNETNLKTAAGLIQRLGLKAICAEDGKLALGHR